MNAFLRRISSVTVVLALGCMCLSGCELDEVEFDERNDATLPAPGDAIGSLGNSLTAGFQNGGLQQKGQDASFPNLLAQTILGRTMSMPLVDSPGIGSEIGLSPLFARPNGGGGADLTREPLTVEPAELGLNTRFPIPYDNLGVPGATTAQILRERNGGLFDLILRNLDDPATPNVNEGLPSGGTCIEQLELIKPNIITVWSGNNEILGGSLSGSPQGTNASDPDTYIVPLSEFEPDFLELLDRVQALNPKMVAVANVPPIAAIPYTKFWNISPPTAPFPGNPRWLMEEDKDGPDTDGNPNNGDDDPVMLVLLPAPVGDCIECYDPRVCGGVGQPCTDIPAEFTLSLSEVTLINDTIAAYNAVIEREATARGFAFVDVNAAFLELPTSSSAVAPLNAAFPINPSTAAVNLGSAFTLDGVHPSERGHAEVANLFLEAFNLQYGTSYPMYELTSIRNEAGLELVLPAGKSGGGPLRITPEARETLAGTVRMLRGRH